MSWYLLLLYTLNACQAVRKAGGEKREELLEYLGTPAGITLAARVAKLLVHAERQEVPYTVHQMRYHTPRADFFQCSITFQQEEGQSREKWASL